MNTTDLLARYEALSRREQRIVLLGAAVAVVVLVLAVFVPLDASIARTHARVLRKQADLAWMREVAPALAAAGPPIAAPSSQRSMIVIIDSSARESGLGSSLASSEPNGPGGLRVRLDKAPFDALVSWLARLSQQSGIHVESATIDKAGPPGTVNAGIVLRGTP